MASYRLHTGLRSLGIDSRMLVQYKTGQDSTVICSANGLVNRWRARYENMDHLPLRLYRDRERVMMSLGWLSNDIARQVEAQKPDLIHLHWINAGFVPVKALSQFHRPLVWRFADFWPFTGGCHYPKSCLRFQGSCGSCPMLLSRREWDVTRWTWNRKKKSWAGIDITGVTASRWLADCAASSSLFADRRMKVIPPGLNTTIYKPLDQRWARIATNLPLDKKIIMMGAWMSTTDKRKGLHLLQPTLRKLASNGWKEKAQLVVFGASEPDDPPGFGMSVRYLGYVTDDVSLALYYSAADVFVAPSTQESFGQTLAEALACGTPCVAFHVSGIPEVVDHNRTGYLAKPFDTDDLAHGIEWILEDADRRHWLSVEARKRAEEHLSTETYAARYADLFEEILRSQA